MKTRIFAMALAVFFLMPCALRADIDYTLELWSENSRLERTISSTISGEKDVVSMDATGLRNGIYLLLLKVDNKVLSTYKLIINR